MKKFFLTLLGILAVAGLIGTLAMLGSRSGSGGKSEKETYVKDELCTIHSGEWAISQLPTATVEGTLSKKCVNCRGVYETQGISPLYNPSDVFTVAEDVITLSTEKTDATAVVNAPKAGFYYVEVKASISSDTYYTMTSSALPHASRHRIMIEWRDTEYSPYGFTVYLNEGENTVTLSRAENKAALNTLTGLRFTRVSEELTAIEMMPTVLHLNGNSQTETHRLSVVEDGFYTLGGLLNFAIADNDFFNMTVTLSREGYADKTIKVDVEDIQSAFDNAGRMYGGSTGTTFYTALSAVGLDAGDYTVTVKLSSSAFGRYVNYQGIVVTPLATE